MMHKTVAVVFLGRLGMASAAACDPVDSCVQLSDGLYCPVNNVQEHADVIKDVAAISTKLKESPPNYAAAKTIYTDGLESSKGPGQMRKLQSLAKKEMTKGGTVTNTWYTGTVDIYGGNPSSPDNIWDKWIIACLDDAAPCTGKSDAFRKYIINKMCIGVMTGYSAYEMGVAINKGENSLTADAEAAYYWDEAAAFYIGNIAPLVGDGVTGSPTSNLYSPYEFNWKRDNDFPDGTNTHAEALKILNYGLINLRGAAYDATNVGNARTAMDKVFAIAAIRSAIKYSFKAVDNEKYVAEGAAYWRTGAGYISTVSAAVKTLVQEVDGMFDLTAGGTLAATVPCQVKTKVEAMYKDLGVTCQMIGTWKDMPSDSTCKTCNDNSATGSLLAGSSAYVDMCKATEAPTPAPTPAGGVSAAPSAHDRSGYCAVPALAVAASWAA